MIRIISCAAVSPAADGGLGVHEYSIVQALLQAADREARSRSALRVRRLQVRVGELSGVEADLLRTAFTAFRERTLCDGAELEIIPVKAAWECPDCRRTIPAGGPLRCAACDGPARLARGDEILLERLELEVA